MKKKPSSATLGTKEREKFVNAISKFLRVASEHPEILVQELYSWTTTSEHGKELARLVTVAATERLRNKAELPVEAVLLIHSDGWIETFGPKQLKISAYTMPWYDVPGDMARDLVEMSMPERLVNLMWPNVMKDMPGFLGAFQVTQKSVECEGVAKTKYTWKQCENPWNLPSQKDDPASS